MPEEVLFKTEQSRTKAEIAKALLSAAEQIKSGSVHLESREENQEVELPESSMFEVEL